MDECLDCWYRIYCRKCFKFYGTPPCMLVSPDDDDIIRMIDDITEDLHAQYD